MSGSSITFLRKTWFVAIAIVTFWFSFVLLDVVCRAAEVCSLVARNQPPDCTPCLHSHPELWLINARCAPPDGDLDSGFECITYDRWDPERRTFVRLSRTDFLATESTLPTLLFSHGNTLTHEKAMETACWPIYERIRACAGPKRLVFWSWPAEPFYKRPLLLPLRLTRRNLTTKYDFSENQGYYIAKLINQMSFAQPVTLSGHSYGGVTIAAALHYLGGGQLNGRTLAGAVPMQRGNLRGAIISGAFDNDSFHPGRKYSQALVPVELLYATFNPRDATLRLWQGFSPRSRPAAGLTGISTACLGENAYKLRQHQLTEYVKRSHYLKPHLATDPMIAAICSTAFPDDNGSSETHCPDCAPLTTIELSQSSVETQDQLTLLPSLR